MRTGIAARLFLALLVAFTAACDAPRSEAPQAAAPLRVARSDPARNHLWVLERDGLSLYDSTSGRRLKRFVLPDWPYVGYRYGCAPDLILDHAGVASVTSDVLPVIWRIDPRRPEIRRIELSLDSDRDKDVGFSELSFAADGSLLAAGATFRSRWRIDPVAATATRIASDAALPGACNAPAMRGE